MSILGILVSVFCLPLAGIMLVYLFWHLVYWYETLNTVEGSIPLPKPGVSLCLGAYFACLGTSLLCLVLRPFGRILALPPGTGASGDGACPPLVLVHGLACNSSVWVYISRRLRAQGYPVSTFSYNSLVTPLPEAVNRLDAHMRLVGDRHPGQKAILIGHSLGGMLARAWLLDARRHERLAGLVTLGTPHGGSKLAVFAPGSLARQLLPASDLVAALALAPEPPFPCAALVSPLDEAVLPAAHLLPPSKPPGKWRVRVTPAVGHLVMLFHPGVASMLLDELRGMRIDTKN